MVVIVENISEEAPKDASTKDYQTQHKSQKDACSMTHLYINKTIKKDMKNGQACQIKKKYYTSGSEQVQRTITGQNQ